MDRVLTLILFAWYTLNVGQAAPSIDQAINDYVHFVSHNKVRRTSFADLEADLIHSFSQLLIFKGAKIFKKKREMLKNRLEQEVTLQSWHWIKIIDRAILGDYLLKATEVLAQLPSGHMAQISYQKIVELIKKDKMPITWMDRMTYRGKSRGLYYHSDRLISIDILDPDEIIFPLIHELTHFLDKDLQDARYNLPTLRQKINLFSRIEHTDWSEDQKNEFGRYWFLKTSYLKNFKEYLPRVNACQTFVELDQLDLLENPSQQDLTRYNSVLSNKRNCYQLAAQELKNEYPAPQFFWSEEKWQYQLVQEYYHKWLKKNGIPDPIY